MLNSKKTKTKAICKRRETYINCELLEKLKTSRQRRMTGDPLKRDPAIVDSFILQEIPSRLGLQGYRKPSLNRLARGAMDGWVREVALGFSLRHAQRYAHVSSVYTCVQGVTLTDWVALNWIARGGLVESGKCPPVAQHCNEIQHKEKASGYICICIASCVLTHRQTKPV